MQIVSAVKIMPQLENTSDASQTLCVIAKLAIYNSGELDHPGAVKVGGDAQVLGVSLDVVELVHIYCISFVDHDIKEVLLFFVF